MLLGKREQPVEDDDDHDRNGELRHPGQEGQSGRAPQHDGEEVKELVGEETDGRTELRCGKLVRPIASEAGPSLRRCESGGPGLEDVVHHFDRVS